MDPWTVAYRLADSERYELRHFETEDAARLACTLSQSNPNILEIRLFAAWDRYPSHGQIKAQSAEAGS